MNAVRSEEPHAIAGIVRERDKVEVTSTWIGAGVRSKRMRHSLFLVV